jgi:predicted nucleotidyltransferase
MNSHVLTEEQVDALRTLRQIWDQEKIVLIGATALGCFIDMHWRQTYDLDLSISVSLDKYPSDLSHIPGWSQDPNLEQRWLAPGIVHIDIIPADSIALSQGGFVWPKSGFSMSLVGMRLAFRHGVPFRPADDFEILVAPVPVIAVLKMIAYQEKPPERIRDLLDIAHIVEEFLPADDQRRYSDEVFDLHLSYEETSAFCLGKEMGSIANERELCEISSFVAMLRNVSDPNATQSRMLQGSAAWRRDPRILLKSLDAFDKGLRLGAKAF